MNVVALSGRATKDVEIKYTPAGKMVANGTIAVQRSFKNAEGKYDADFIDFVCWGKGAETMANYIKKGDKFSVSGEWQTRMWEKEGGSKQKVSELNVTKFDLPDKKPGQFGQQQQQQQPGYSNNSYYNDNQPY